MGCAFDDGRGFARLSAELSASFEGLSPEAGRLQSDGWIRTDNDFEFLPTKLALEVHAIAVYGGAAASPTGDCVFDPANPPEGCGSCHGGHCHCGDALVSYEELEAQVCGTSTASTASSLVRLGELLSPLGLLTEEAPRLIESCSPHCELGQGTLSEVRLELGALELEGTLRDGGELDRLAGEKPSIRIAAHLHDTMLVAPFEHGLVIDRDTPYKLHLELELHVAAGLLDGVAWEALERTGSSIVVDEQLNEHTGHVLAANLSQSDLHVHVLRDGVEEEEHEHEAEH